MWDGCPLILPNEFNSISTQNDQLWLVRVIVEINTGGDFPRSIGYCSNFVTSEFLQ